MIVFDLHCRTGGHRFEAWFRSSQDFAEQQERQLLICPECGAGDIEKAVMAPAVGRKGNQVAERPVERPVAQAPAALEAVPDAQVATVTPEMRDALETLVRMQKKALEKSRWVGPDFADEARAMHYGEREAEPIHGEATTEQVEDLIDEGVDIAPLPFPVAPPDIVN